MNLFYSFFHHLSTGIQRKFPMILLSFFGNYAKGVLNGFGEVNIILNIHGLVTQSKP